jgi:hypothetical protein
VQIVGGLSITKVPVLASSNTFGTTCTPGGTGGSACSSGGSPPTVQNFKLGGYVGLSFDIKSFIQSIGSAAFSASSAGGSAGTGGSAKGGGG